MKRAVSLVAFVIVVTLGTSGCEFTGLNGLPLPGTQGRGDGSYRVEAVMQDVTNVVPNTPVRLDDLEVGTVEGIHLEGYTAVVTIGLNHGVQIPANDTLKTAQTSLLGAKHLEFDPPPAGEAPQGLLHDGDRIPLDRTGGFPDTEQVLATVALFLNGGGLQQIRTITTELNRALGGRESDVRSALANLSSFTAGLDRQRGDIIRAIEGLNRLSAEVAGRKDVLQQALQVAPPALDVLNGERETLEQTLDSLAHFGDVASDVINRSRGNLVANLTDLQAPLQRLADSGDSLTRSLRLAATILFPTDGIDRLYQGDYVNFFVTIDATLGTLDRNFLTGTPLSGVLASAQNRIGGANGAGNPLANLVPGQSSSAAGGGH